EKPGEGGIVARSLSAQPDLDAGRFRISDRVFDHPLHRCILFIEQCGQIRRIPVDAERELSEIVTADGEAVETLGELPGQDNVRWDFAHDIDLQAVLAPLE